MSKNVEKFMEEIGDAWFERNYERKQFAIPMACKLFEKAIKHRLENMKSGSKILEIGCSFGYNLVYLCGKYNLEGYGVDPSKEAIRHGNDMIQNSGIVCGWGGGTFRTGNCGYIIF